MVVTSFELDSLFVVLSPNAVAVRGSEVGWALSICMLWALFSHEQERLKWELTVGVLGW